MLRLVDGGGTVVSSGGIELSCARHRHQRLEDTRNASVMGESPSNCVSADVTRDNRYDTELPLLLISDGDNQYIAVYLVI